MTNARSHDHRRRLVASVIASGALVALVGCQGDAEPESSPTPAPATSTPRESPSERVTPTPVPAPTPTATPATFDPTHAMATVNHLAGQIGPREATSAQFRAAADYVAGQFESWGYRVSRVPVPVPAGDSWGVPVEAGTSANVIADPTGLRPDQPHVVIGAHLDTVAVAPGAEDNASGVAVLLELARMVAEQPPSVPVRFVAFGAEEPRGRGDDQHHFGSQLYVRELSAAGRAAVVGMVALDRVGVRADHVPVCTGGRGVVTVRDALIAAAQAAGIAVQACENRASDHWSFEKDDIPSARLGSIPYAAYHSAQDVPAVVDPTQLARVGGVAWAWLRSL